MDGSGVQRGVEIVLLVKGAGRCGPVKVKGAPVLRLILQTGSGLTCVNAGPGPSVMLSASGNSRWAMSRLRAGHVSITLS